MKSLKENKRKIIKYAVFFLIVKIFIIQILLYVLHWKIVFQTDYSVNFRIGFINARINQLKDFKKGDYIGFQFLAVKDDPRYGMEFVKKVSCLPGEYLIYSMEDNTFYCNGIPVGSPKPYSKTGKPLRPFYYAGRIPEGHLFVTGETYHSYDSKYWGFVKESWIRGKIYKIAGIPGGLYES